MAFNEKARYALANIIDRVGQIFEFKFLEKTFYGLNITHCINGLDLENSTFDPDNPQRISEYQFHAGRVGESPFTIPETRFVELLAVEGNVARCDEFKAVIEDGGLTGVRFEHLWSGIDPEGLDDEDDYDDDFWDELDDDDDD